VEYFIVVIGGFLASGVVGFALASWIGVDDYEKGFDDATREWGHRHHARRVER
jgi:hypothetical protein